MKADRQFDAEEVCAVCRTVAKDRGIRLIATTGAAGVTLAAEGVVAITPLEIKLNRGEAMIDLLEFKLRSIGIGLPLYNFRVGNLIGKVDFANPAPE